LITASVVPVPAVAAPRSAVELCATFDFMAVGDASVTVDKTPHHQQSAMAVARQFSVSYPCVPTDSDRTAPRHLTRRLLGDMAKDSGSAPNTSGIDEPETETDFDAERHRRRKSAWNGWEKRQFLA
jgi:hypothetical protein